MFGDDQTSVYSFTSYNTSHYSDIGNRLNQKVNTYAIEMNRKVKNDNESLNDMEEGIIALANYLNGVEEKQPSVSELIGSRINLDDCLKLKLEIREKIRKTKKIRTDLFTTSSAVSGLTTDALNQQNVNVPKIRVDVTPILTPQTSRALSPKDTSRKSGQLSSSESDAVLIPKVRKPKPNAIETSKSFSSLPSSTPPPSTTSKSSVTITHTTNLLNENNNQNNNIHTEKRYSQSIESNQLAAAPPPAPATAPPASIKQPLITSLIPNSSTQRHQKSLMPVDDLADRQLAWLLNIEAKKRQIRQALEAQSIRELKVVPDISKAQQSWNKVKKIHKKKYGMEVHSKRGSDLDSIDENATISSTSASSSLNTLLLRYYQGNENNNKSYNDNALKQQQQRQQKEKGSKRTTSTDLSSIQPLRSTVTLEPLSKTFPIQETSSTSKLSHLKKKIFPSDQEEGEEGEQEELHSFQMEEEGEQEQRRGRGVRDMAPIQTKSLHEGGVIDCETPRVITWTDLSYDPLEYSNLPVKPMLKPLSFVDSSEVERDHAVISTSRSDESDYEPEWDRANRKMR